MLLRSRCLILVQMRALRATRWALSLTASLVFTLAPISARSQTLVENSPRDIIRASHLVLRPDPAGHADRNQRLKPAAQLGYITSWPVLDESRADDTGDRFSGYYLISCEESVVGCAGDGEDADNSTERELPFADREMFAMPSFARPLSLSPSSRQDFMQSGTGAPGKNSSSSSLAAKEGFHWWPALQTSFNFLVFEHAVRIASDPFLRYLLWHKPFWLDYGISTQHFFFNQWGDGDDFLVNYIGHPLQGAVTGNIQIVNDPKGRSLTFGRSKSYWMSRLRAMAWSAVYSAQFEAGPMLSEAAIGSEGGYFYRKGCDPNITCAHPSPDPITNNTGWVDFVVTPLVGTGWIVMEDAIETEIVDKLAKGDDRLRWKLLRAGLSPGHVMANFMAGKVPWYRYRLDGPDGGSIFGRSYAERPKFSWDDVQRWEIGGHYAYLSLPMDWEGCEKCRVGNSGFGMNFAYRITNHLWFDSDVNFFPGSGSVGEKGHTVEGLFGPRYGLTRKSWGLYLKLRPGFIYYDKTLTADSGDDFTVATRFAFDFGSEFEWHTSRHSSIRIDAGTTVVRYLTGIVDPRQPQKAFISTDYIVSQSNFQIGTGYTYRF